MQPINLFVNLALAFSILPIAIRADETPPARESIQRAVEVSIPLLERGSKGSLEQRKQCFNCHNQGLPIMALVTARSRGIPIDEDNLTRQVQFTADFLARNKSRYLEGEGQGGQVDTAGYALWTLDNAGWKADETTDAVAEYFLLRQSDREHYRPESDRPPSEKSFFTSSYVALRGLKAFGTTEQKERIEARFEQLRQWILKTQPTDTEDRVFRLRALHLVSAGEHEVKKAGNDLLAMQRQDGGWSQLPEMESDAYATGSVLVALHHTGQSATTDPAYANGLRYLISIQKEDGSWHVVSRSKPFQTYFESGYPHGKDQFISMAAGGWATTALALALPEPIPVESAADALNAVPPP